MSYTFPILPNKTTTSVHHMSGEQLSKEVFISQDDLKTIKFKN